MHGPVDVDPGQLGGRAGGAPTHLTFRLQPLRQSTSRGRRKRSLNWVICRDRSLDGVLLAESGGVHVAQADGVA